MISVSKIINLFKLAVASRFIAFLMSDSEFVVEFIEGYISTLRNNVRSRAWGAAVGCSYRIERCSVAKVWITILHSFPSVLSGL